MIATKAGGTGDPKEFPLLLWLDLVWTHLEDTEIICDEFDDDAEEFYDNII